MRAIDLFSGQHIGIRQRIRYAESAAQIDELLRELDGYDHPSAQTIAACRTAARKRRRELQEALQMAQKKGKRVHD